MKDPKTEGARVAVALAVLKLLRLMPPRVLEQQLKVNPVLVLALVIVVVVVVVVVVGAQAAAADAAARARAAAQGEPSTRTQY